MKWFVMGGRHVNVPVTNGSEAVMPQMNRHGFGWAKEGFRPNVWLPGLTTAALFGVTEAIFLLSFGSLVFSGELSQYLSHGLGLR
jgi:hypothetical protein